MSLEAFKVIYLWEFWHRIVARLAGVAFALPFAWFVARRSLPAFVVPRLAILLAFLGAQGDIWDSHWDMLLALLGSILAQLSFASTHDRALRVPPMQLGNRVGVK